MLTLLTDAYGYVSKSIQEKPKNFNNYKGIL